MASSRNWFDKLKSSIDEYKGKMKVLYWVWGVGSGVILIIALLDIWLHQDYVASASDSSFHELWYVYFLPVIGNVAIITVLMITSCSFYTLKK